MPVSDKSYRVIWGQFAGRCFMCRDQLVERTQSGEQSLLGEVAHIVGERKNAARGNGTMSAAERNHPDNLLLTCRRHHKLIDDDPVTYTIEWLIDKKLEYLDWVASSLAPAKPWSFSIDHLTYINVPRLSEQAERRGFRVDLSRYREEKSLSSLGWDLNHVMASFERVLSQLTFDAVPFDALSLHEGHVGKLISFDRVRFRTKNITGEVGQDFTGDLGVDPHIYCRKSEFTLIANIDARWITTATAFSLFRSGQCFLSGLARVSNVDYESGQITVTPLVLGVSDGRSDSRSHISDPPSIADDLATELDKLSDMVEGARRSIYFWPPPDACELCGRILGVGTYMVDTAMVRGGPWACMCGKCFFAREGAIGWGKGQLYRRDSKGWLQVAGFSPDDEHEPL